MPRATRAMLLIIQALLQPGDHYGFSLLQETGLGAGTLYPILSRLEEDYRWVTSRWEESPLAGRPRRRIYTVTSMGNRQGAAFLAEHGHRLRAGSFAL